MSVSFPRSVLRGKSHQEQTIPSPPRTASARRVRGNFRGSAEQFADRFGALGCQPDRPRPDIVAVARIDAQRLVDRREQVALGDRPILDLLAVGVSAADHLPAFDAAAGQYDRPGPDVVVTAGAVVDLWRPPDLTHP